MREGLFGRLLGRVSGAIRRLARELQRRISGIIYRRRRSDGTIPDISPQELVEALRTFDGPFAQELADAFGEVTGERVSTEDMRRFIIGEVSLSSRLYHQARATSARVRRILQAHARYAHDARQLALDLFEGYGFRDVETLNPIVRLPKYLDDAILNGEMDALMARIQATAIKTAPLRAGYLQLLEQVLSGAGQDAIDRALEVAVFERYRYFANRIARTELARAQHRETARELMGMDEIEVVRYRLSGGHVTDMCDAFAHVDRYGLGPGLYPKALAPLPPIHTHCLCMIHPVVGVTAAGARERPEAISDYLRTLDERTAARVAGSRAKREEILAGGNWEDMLNRGRPEAYKIGRLGDVRMKSPDQAWAAERLRRARSSGWPENALKPGSRMTRETLAALERSRSVPEVAAFLDAIKASGYRVNALDWHYFKYKYQYGDHLHDARTLNERFDAVLRDPRARVLKSGERLKVFSTKEGRLAIIDAEGRRITVYRPDETILADWEDAQWWLQDLLG